jgi:hypothetical protein
VRSGESFLGMAERSPGLRSHLTPVRGQEKRLT